MKNTIVFLLCIFGVSGCVTTRSKLQFAKPVAEFQCSKLDNVKSTEGESRYEIQFANSRDETVEMFWINYEGEEELKQTMLPGDRWGVNTYVSHPWVVRDESGECLAVYNRKSSVLVEIK